MITATGYSKDQFIQPEGIVITFGREMIEEQGGLLCFLRNFEECMQEVDDGRFWMHKCSNLPTQEFDKVYIVVANRLYGRVNFGGAENFPTTGFTANGQEKVIEWKRIILAGPIEKPPFKRTMKGFQGFRYCTKLF